MRDIALQIMSAPEGGTASMTGEDLPHYGYWVGGSSATLVFRPGYEHLRDLIRAFIRDLPTEWVGWWTDEETGRLYVEATDWFEDRATAERVGRERHELAIRDISGERDLRFVYVDGE